MACTDSSITETEDSENDGSSESRVSSSDTGADSSALQESADQAQDLNNSVDLTEVTELSSSDDISKKLETEQSENLKDCTDDNIDFTSHNWYKHRLFQRYWDHYRQSMTWCKRHTSVSKKLSGNKQQNLSSQHRSGALRYPSPISYSLNAYQPWYRQYPAYTQSHTESSSRQQQGKQKKSRRRKRCKRHHSNSSFSVTSEATQTEDNETFEMEITQEMVDFFAKSEEHRKQRDKDKKDASTENMIEHVNVEEAHTTSHSGPSVEAPKERPGARRTAEMKMLYGKGAAMIHGMETALQMMYDRNVDLKQPKMWPNMPLRPIF